MRDRYDFAGSTPDSHARRTKQQITIRLDRDTMSYFKTMAEDKGVPYQNLINLYLRDCATARHRLRIE